MRKTAQEAENGIGTEGNASAPVVSSGTMADALTPHPAATGMKYGTGHVESAGAEVGTKSTEGSASESLTAEVVSTTTTMRGDASVKGASTSMESSALAAMEAESSTPEEDSVCVPLMNTGMAEAASDAPETSTGMETDASDADQVRYGMRGPTDVSAQVGSNGMVTAARSNAEMAKSQSGGSVPADRDCLKKGADARAAQMASSTMEHDAQSPSADQVTTGMAKPAEPMRRLAP